MASEKSIESRLLKLCEEVRDNDDSLGAYSDYEGSTHGPTYYLWREGYEKFSRHCERAIRDHRMAIATFEKLALLNHERKEATND